MNPALPNRPTSVSLDISLDPSSGTGAGGNAYMLVAHGSRDPRHGPALARLAAAVADRLGQQQPGCQQSPAIPTTTRVGSGFLEVQETPLHQQIQEFAEGAIAQGCHTLHLLPLFLLPGVHVMEDIPAEVAIAQAALHGRLTLALAPYLGQAPNLPNALAAHLPPPATATRILLAHGTRRPGGNAPIEALAASLDLIPAYWSLEPSLEQQVQACLARGDEAICVLPYVLFPGGITDAIAQRLASLAQEYPSRRLWQTAPLDGLVPLAHWIVEWMIRPHVTVASTIS